MNKHAGFWPVFVQKYLLLTYCSRKCSNKRIQNYSSKCSQCLQLKQHCINCIGPSSRPMQISKVFLLYKPFTNLSSINSIQTFNLNFAALYLNQYRQNSNWENPYTPYTSSKDINDNLTCYRATTDHQNVLCRHSDSTFSSKKNSNTFQTVSQPPPCRTPPSPISALKYKSLGTNFPMKLPYPLHCQPKDYSPTTNLPSYNMNPHKHQHVGQPPPCCAPDAQPSPCCASIAQPSPCCAPVTQPTPCCTPVTQPSPCCAPKAQPSPCCAPLTQPTPCCTPVTQPSPCCAPIAQPLPCCVPIAQPSPCCAPLTQPTPCCAPVSPISKKQNRICSEFENPVCSSHMNPQTIQPIAQAPPCRTAISPSSTIKYSSSESNSPIKLPYPLHCFPKDCSPTTISTLPSPKLNVSESKDPSSLPVPERLQYSFKARVNNGTVQFQGETHRVYIKKLCTEPPTKIIILMPIK